MSLRQCDIKPNIGKALNLQLHPSSCLTVWKRFVKSPRKVMLASLNRNTVNTAEMN